MWLITNAKNAGISQLYYCPDLIRVLGIDNRAVKLY